MYLLDTVAVSETSKPSLHPGMSSFLAGIQEPTLYISVVSIGEFVYGWQKLPLGKRREAFREWALQTEEQFSGRVISVDSAISAIWGEIRATTRQNGYNIGLPGLLIAASAIRHDFTVVTRNEKDFEPTGCKIINPWA